MGASSDVPALKVTSHHTFLVAMIFSVMSQPMTVTSSPICRARSLARHMRNVSEHICEEVQRMAAQRKTEEGQFVRKLLWTRIFRRNWQVAWRFLRL